MQDGETHGDSDLTAQEGDLILSITGDNGAAAAVLLPPDSANSLAILLSRFAHDGAIMRKVHAKRNGLLLPEDVTAPPTHSLPGRILKRTADWIDAATAKFYGVRK